MKAVVTGSGVDIIDTNGAPLANITEQDALELYESLRSKISKIRKWAKIMK